MALLLEATDPITALERGAWSTAADAAHASLSRDELPASRRAEALVTIGLLRARRGDPEVWEPLDAALELVAAADAASIRLARAEAHALCGETDGVDAETTRVLTSARTSAELGAACVWRHRSGLPFPACIELPERFAAELAGDAARAAAAWQRLARPYEAALAFGSGDVEQQRDALATLQQLGAHATAAVVARRLRERGVRNLRRGPRARTRENPAGLTPREVEVLGLLQEGARNSDIAARLFLSEKTVGHHVSAILRKLDVRTRGQAAARAHRLNLAA